MIASIFFSKNELSELIPFYIFVVIAANGFTVSFLVPWVIYIINDDFINCILV